MLGKTQGYHILTTGTTTVQCKDFLNLPSLYYIKELERKLNDHPRNICISTYDFTNVNFVIRCTNRLIRWTLSIGFLRQVLRAYNYGKLCDSQSSTFSLISGAWTDPSPANLSAVVESGMQAVARVMENNPSNTKCKSLGL